MRTINATLLSNQKALDGLPSLTCTIGTAPNTADVSAFVVEYEYEESVREAGLTLILNNADDTFTTLSGDYANIIVGAEVELKRGITVDGTDYEEELPTVWIESISYDYDQGVSVCLLECLDFWGKLARWRASSEQSWASTSVTTILEWILTQVGLTRESGAMTALSINFTIKLRETGYQAARRLIRKIPEYLHAGIDGEVKWREIDGAEGSAYTFGWNAEHPVLSIQSGESAWETNSITVRGGGGTTGTASDATQIAAVGTRKFTIYDWDIRTNGDCAVRAQAELDRSEAGAIEAILQCRPCHGLELYDVVTMASPPWGGSNVVGRVVQLIERYSISGDWYQRIVLGDPPPNQTAPTVAAYRRLRGLKAPKKGRSSRRRRKRRSRGRRRTGTWAWIVDSIQDLLDAITEIYDALFGENSILPIGAIIMWSGDVTELPPGWALCDGDNGTPDLGGKFIVSTGDNGTNSYVVGDEGGADEINIAHTHDPGTLANANDGAHNHGGNTDYAGNHAHTSGTYATDSDGHNHTPNTFATDTEANHGHGPGSLTTGTPSATAGEDVAGPAEAADSEHTHTLASGTTAVSGQHSHTVASGATSTDTHSHDVTGSSQTTGSHRHVINSASAHTHTISGATATALSATQDIRPTYYALAFIMRIE